MAHGKPKLPEISPTHTGESSSLRAMREVFEGSGMFTVRKEAEKDYGVDGSVEVVLQDSITGKHFATNRRAYFQLKHTSKEPSDDGTIAYPVAVTNFNYLSQQPPAFYLIYVISTRQLLFRWWQDIYHELLGRSDDWTEQTTLSIRFHRTVDREALDELKIEINSHAEQVLQLQDGPSFVRDFCGTRLPKSMLPDKPFVDRIEETKALATRTTRGSILPILGLPESGKTELVRHYLADVAAMKA